MAMNFSIIILSSAGFFVSLYALFIERALRADATYRPACDISNRISCTKALLGPYNTMFGISRALWGLLFYALMAGAALLNMHVVVFWLSVAGLCASGVLAYVLYFKVRSFCLVCTTIYLINIGLFFASYL